MACLYIPDSFDFNEINDSKLKKLLKSHKTKQDLYHARIAIEILHTANTEYNDLYANNISIIYASYLPQIEYVDDIYCARCNLLKRHTLNCIQCSFVITNCNMRYLACNAKPEKYMSDDCNDNIVHCDDCIDYIQDCLHVLPSDIKNIITTYLNKN